MTQLKLRRWIGATAAGFALVLGCSQAQHRCASCSRPRVVAQPVATLPAPAPAIVPAPVVAATPAPVVLPETTVVKNPEPEPVVVQTGYALPPTGGHNDAAKRRTYADITANGNYGHAPDYSWLIGELQFVHVRNAWRVRYASVDEEDRYGGSVTLLEAGPMTDYQSGQIVKVEGQLVDPESREPSPPYRVRQIQLLSPH